MQGAVVQAPRIDADIGGTLLIESRQDTSRFAGKQQSQGGSVTIGAGPSGSLSASQSKVNSNYASVVEQSALRAGDGGFQVTVKGATELKGGAITGTLAAIDQNNNAFSTGCELTTGDIQNRAEYKASSVSVNVGSSFSAQGKLTPQGTSAGIGN